MTTPYRFKTTPYKHQLDCWERNREKTFFAYLMDMGTGKSKVLLDTAAYMYDRGWINALLIFANKGSYLNWPRQEIPTHLPDHIPRDVVVWASPMTKDESRHLDRVLHLPMMALKIFVVNVEALAFTRGFETALMFAGSHRTMTAVDESSTIKNHQAKRTKAAMKIRDVSKVRRIMTGSCVDNSPLNAFSQFEFLQEGCLGFGSYYSFRAEYADMTDMRMAARSFKKVVGYRNLEDLRDRMGRNAFVIKKEDCLDLPPKVFQTFDVELTDEQKRAYDDLRKRLITEFERQVCSVKIMVTKLLRLHQLVCGHLPDDEGNVHEIPSNRIQALMDVIEETRGQVIIWATYRADIKAIEAALKKEYGDGSTLSYYGDTSGEDREVVQAAFKRGSGSDVRFMVSNPQTGAYGINLTGATTAVYYSNNFDAEKRNQSEDRCHRIGQTESVTYIDLVARGTVDEKILAALKQKKSLSDLITASNWRSFL